MQSGGFFLRASGTAGPHARKPCALISLEKTLIDGGSLKPPATTSVVSVISRSPVHANSRGGHADTG
jgi:hypothetical protein